MIPRKAGKHWSFPVELGAAIGSRPEVRIALQGTVCQAHGACYNAASDRVVLGPLHDEEKRRTNHLSWMRFYPLISAGVAYRF